MTKPTVERPGLAPGIILATVALGVFVAADDLTVVSTMLRTMVADLQIPLPDDLDKAAWIVNAYLIAYVVVMPFMGRVSDIVGRRAVYVTSMAVFMVGSIWIPLAPQAGVWIGSRLPAGLDWRPADISFAFFLIGRVLTALGGGAMVPVAMAVVADIYPARRRAAALGILGTIETSGWVWGPLYGALLVRFLDWRWQFYFNIPLALIGIATGLWALRRLPRVASAPAIDWVGTALLSGGLLALNVGLLNSGSIQNVGSLVDSLSDLGSQSFARTVPFLVAGVAALAAFVRYERRLGRRNGRVPILDLDLFRRRNFTPAVVVNFVVGGILIIAMVNVPLVINVLEIDPQQAALDSGWLLSALTGSMAIMAYVGGRWTERSGYRPVTVLSLVACAVGFGFMGFLWGADITYGQMAWQLVILGVGFGLATAPVGAAIINAAPEDQRGIASSLVIVFRLMGMSVGLSALTAWGQYRFNFLRTTIDVPSITDPGFGAALTAALTKVTVDVLSETFVICALLAALVIFVALRLRPDEVEET